MSGDDELKGHALNGPHDFYALLEVQPSASESDIKRAYRRTALKYHPDKVGASNTAAIEKFHLLQIAYDVLLDSEVRQLYDNARRAREEKKEREATYEGRRRQLKEELERRESAGVAGLKRKREDAAEEDAFQVELRRLAADGARRRKEREQQLRKEAQEEYTREQDEWLGKMNGDSIPTSASTPASGGNTGVDDINRTITLRYPATTQAPGNGGEAKPLDREFLISRFNRFGKVEEAVLRNKKIKVNGEKHRREYTTALVVFESVVGAHAAVMDIPDLAEKEIMDNADDVFWNVLENVGWAAGKEPDFISGPATPDSNGTQKLHPRELNLQTPQADPLADKTNEYLDDGLLRKAPSFSSFKGLNTPKSTPGVANGNGIGLGSPSVEELTMIRLKNAERKRLAEKLRKEDEAAEAAEGN